jgi:hypothetical protein
MTVFYVEIFFSGTSFAKQFIRQINMPSTVNRLMIIRIVTDDEFRINQLACVGGGYENHRIDRLGTVRSLYLLPPGEGCSRRMENACRI